MSQIKLPELPIHPESDNGHQWNTSEAESIQAYARSAVVEHVKPRELAGLTERELLDMFDVVGTAETSIDARIYMTAYNKIEAKLKKKNT